MTQSREWLVGLYDRFPNRFHFQVFIPSALAHSVNSLKNGDPRGTKQLSGKILLLGFQGAMRETR